MGKFNSSRHNVIENGFHIDIKFLPSLDRVVRFGFRGFVKLWAVESEIFNSVDCLQKPQSC